MLWNLKFNNNNFNFNFKITFIKRYRFIITCFNRFITKFFRMFNFYRIYIITIWFLFLSLIYLFRKKFHKFFFVNFFIKSST